MKTTERHDAHTRHRRQTEKGKKLGSDRATINSTLGHGRKSPGEEELNDVKEEQGRMGAQVPGEGNQAQNHPIGTEA